MLDLPKHRLVFDLPSSICRRPFFRGQPFPNLLPLLLILQRNADGFRVFAFGACRLKRASGTCRTTIRPFDGNVPVVGRFLPFIHKHQPFPFGTNPLIQLLIIRHVLDSPDLLRPLFLQKLGPPGDGTGLSAPSAILRRHPAFPGGSLFFESPDPVPVMEEQKQEEIGGKQEKGSEKKGQHVDQPEQMEIERNEDEQNQGQENPLLHFGCTASASF